MPTHAGCSKCTAASNPLPARIAASLDLLSNIDPSEAHRMQSASSRKAPPILEINCYLLRGAGHTILVDTGTGSSRPSGGKLASSLTLARVEPGEIDTILLTNAHPDHVGGLVGADGQIMFPHAELLVHQREFRFWNDDRHLSQANARAQGNFLIARQIFRCYHDKLRTFDQGEVLPGIRAMPLPGHTAGHTAYLLESQDQGVLVWGDIVHFPHIQVTQPEVSIAFDQDPGLAMATRSQILKQAIAGMHLGAPGFARIKQTGSGYRLVYAADASGKRTG